MVWDGYVAEDKTPDTKDPKFLDWSKTKLLNLGEYVKRKHSAVYNGEETIRGVNDILYTMCKHCSPLIMKTFTFERFCLEGGSRLISKYRWYPGLVRVYGDGSSANPDSLALGVITYSITCLKGREVPKSDFFLTYENMKHSPETIEAYERCVRILPELIVAYIEYVIETTK